MNLFSSRKKAYNTAIPENGIMQRKNRSEMTVFEYRVEIYAVREAEEKMNRMAADGWRVIAVSPNLALGHGIVVTFERQK